MLSPYFLVSFLFVGLAVLGVFDSALANVGIMPWFNGLRWLRVHFITLGVLVETAFGVLPILVARAANVPRPKMRWDIWLLLNAGVLVLLVGIPLVNLAVIFTGGTLVFSATVLLLVQLINFHPTLPPHYFTRGFPFYVAGISFLLLGIIFGTGLWLGWGVALQAVAPKEVHLHANLWGFTSFVFAGLLIDLYPLFANRSLAWQKSIPLIFALFLLGDVGLIIVPWLGWTALTVPPLILHHAATAVLLANLLVPLVQQRNGWSIGLSHILFGYSVILAPLLVAPFIVLSGHDLPMTYVEASAPQLLIYAWVMPIAFALTPWLAARILLRGETARLGGNVFSLILLMGGVICFVPSLFSDQAQLQAVAYMCWAAAWLPIGWQLWQLAVKFDAESAV